MDTTVTLPPPQSVTTAKMVAVEQWFASHWDAAQVAFLVLVLERMLGVFRQPPAVELTLIWPLDRVDAMRAIITAFCCSVYTDSEVDLFLSKFFNGRSSRV